MINGTCSCVPCPVHALLYTICSSCTSSKNLATGHVLLQGIYYGTFPGSRLDAAGRPTSLWVVSRPHNWHPLTSLELLLEIDMQTGNLTAASVVLSVNHSTNPRIGSWTATGSMTPA